MGFRGYQLSKTFYGPELKLILYGVANADKLINAQILIKTRSASHGVFRVLRWEPLPDGDCELVVEEVGA